MTKERLTPEALRTIRKDMQWSQAAMADFFGVSRVTYNKWENNRAVKGIPLWVAQKVAELKVPTAQIEAAPPVELPNFLSPKPIEIPQFLPVEQKPVQTVDVAAPVHETDLHNAMSLLTDTPTDSTHLWDNEEDEQ